MSRTQTILRYKSSVCSDRCGGWRWLCSSPGAHGLKSEMFDPIPLAVRHYSFCVAFEAETNFTNERVTAGGSIRFGRFGAPWRQCCLLMRHVRALRIQRLAVGTPPYGMRNLVVRGRKRGNVLRITLLTFVARYAWSRSPSNRGHTACELESNSACFTRNPDCLVLSDCCLATYLPKCLRIDTALSWHIAEGWHSCAVRKPS